MIGPQEIHSGPSLASNLKQLSIVIYLEVAVERRHTIGVQELTVIAKGGRGGKDSEQEVNE